MPEWTDKDVQSHDNWMAAEAVKKLLEEDAQAHMKKLGADPHDVISMCADILGGHDLCADCGHALVNPYFHLEAPGKTWGAALHHHVSR